jgi:hypothetical protein
MKAAPAKSMSRRVEAAAVLVLTGITNPDTGVSVKEFCAKTTAAEPARFSCALTPNVATTALAEGSTEPSRRVCLVGLLTDGTSENKKGCSAFP